MVAAAFFMPSVLAEPPLVAIIVAALLRVDSGVTLNIASATDVAELDLVSTAEHVPAEVATTVALPAV